MEASEPKEMKVSETVLIILNGFFSYTNLLGRTQLAFCLDWIFHKSFDFQNMNFKRKLIVTQNYMIFIAMVDF